MHSAVDTPEGRRASPIFSSIRAQAAEQRQDARNGAVDGHVAAGPLVSTGGSQRSALAAQAAQEGVQVRQQAADDLVCEDGGLLVVEVVPAQADRAARDADERGGGGGGGSCGREDLVRRCDAAAGWLEGIHEPVRRAGLLAEVRGAVGHADEGVQRGRLGYALVAAVDVHPQLVDQWAEAEERFERHRSFGRDLRGLGSDVVAVAMGVACGGEH